MPQALKARHWLLAFLLSALPCAGLAAVDQLPGSHQPIETEWLKAWESATDQPTDYVNRLALSESAYLKQHANNPIDWFAWSDEAFEIAAKDNKLIFLSIGYASCHWCHVMESECFMDVDVATVLNQSMVSVKVDREQQPDIDAWFTMAVEAISGTSGWPITMILLPDQTPVFAANYLTKDQLITAVTRFENIWQKQPQALVQNGQLLLDEINQRMQNRSSSTLPRSQWLETAQSELLASIDTTHGGFGADRKFPDEIKLQFLLNRYKSSRDETLKAQLIYLLDAFKNSGLSDVVYGGIFRYTTNEEMSRPHFEKMLYNQALTVSLFSDAAHWLGQPPYQRFANRIVEFVDSTMQLEDGMFAAAIDADHGGTEGGYYLWTEQRLQGFPDNLVREPFGSNLIFLYGAYSKLTDDWTNELRASRDDTPRIIDHSITAWNALWVSALLQAGHAEKATRLAETIWQKNWRQQQLFRMGNVPGFLDDYGYLSDAYWQLYINTGVEEWQSRARLLDTRMLDLFYDQGKLAYQSDQHDQRFEIDSFQDKELPAALPYALRSFQHHQAESRFVEAIEQLNKSLLEAVGTQPQYYLTLIELNEKQYPEPAQIIAKGHGRIALGRSSQKNKWQVEIELEDGWHVNAADVLDSRLVATHVQASDDILKVTYPEGHLLETEFSDENLNVYSNKIVLDLETHEDLTVLETQIRLQACSNEVCLLPEDVKLIAW